MSLAVKLSKDLNSVSQPSTLLDFWPTTLRLNYQLVWTWSMSTLPSQSLVSHLKHTRLPDLASRSYQHWRCLISGLKRLKLTLLRLGASQIATVKTLAWMWAHSPLLLVNKQIMLECLQFTTLEALTHYLWLNLFLRKVWTTSVFSSFWRLILLKVLQTQRKQKVERTKISKFPNGIKSKSKLCLSQSMLMLTMMLSLWSFLTFWTNKLLEITNQSK